MENWLPIVFRAVANRGEIVGLIRNEKEDTAVVAVDIVGREYVVWRVNLTDASTYSGQYFPYHDTENKLYKTFARSQALKNLHTRSKC